MVWTVSRQRQWPDGGRVVEISQGGVDYCNPDCLSPKYSGELEEYADPIEAVEAAINIAQAWQENSPDEKILIDHGATGGMTLPFDGMELSEETFQELREWGRKVYEKLPKCSQCGGILPEEGKRWVNRDLLWDEEFCSEHCVEKAVEAALDEEEE